MADYDYVLFDTAVFGVAANTEHTLFQVPQGGDATHTEAFTNMRGAGALPAEEAFRIEEIHVMVDVNGAVADLQDMWVGNFLEIRIADRTLLKIPLVMAASHNEFGGMYTQETAADEALIGRKGDGFKLKVPLQLPGGTSFRVRIQQVTAMSAASQNVKVALRGTLTMP